MASTQDKHGAQEPGDEAGVDWVAVELEYRTNKVALRKIGANHGVSEGAIRKRAKKFGWVRDLQAEIDLKAEELVRKELVRNTVRTVRSPSERDIIQCSAEINAQAQADHIRQAAQSVTMTAKLVEEIEAMGDARDDLRQLAELLAEGEQEDLARACRKVVSLPSRIDSVKKLIEAQRIAIELERKVRRIKDDGPAESKADSGPPLSAQDSYMLLINK